MTETYSKKKTMSALSNFLRAAMKDLGWEQQDLVNESGIPKSTISRLLTDKIDEPELSTLFRVAQALNVPLWRVIELAGFPLERPIDDANQQRRLADLASAFPWLVPVIDEMASLDPSDKEGVLTFLETMRRRRKSPTN